MRTVRTVCLPRDHGSTTVTAVSFLDANVSTLGEAAEISEEMNLAKAAIDKAAEEKSTTAADTA